MTRCERAAAADGREDAGCNSQVEGSWSNVSCDVWARSCAGAPTLLTSQRRHAAVHD